MAELVYLLCAATSIVSAVLLLRSFRQTRVRLLFWSGLCFVGLALNNVLLCIDLVVVPQVDLFLVRTALGLGAMMILLFGLLWEEQ